MNKMDLNVTPESEVVEKSRFNIPPVVRKVAVFAAPVLVLAGGAGAFMLMAITAPKPEENAAEARAVAVQYATASARPTVITINVQGEARPRNDASLSAQVAGRIVWISPAFADGGSFREGDTLARIDPADYQLAVVRAQAQVAQAQEALTREEAEGELARQDWAVLGQGDPSPLAAREPQLAQARAMLASAQAQLRGAELDLARTNIRAPFTGRVRSRAASIGDYVAPGAAVAEVFATDVMEIRVPLTDSDLAALRLPVGFVASSASRGPVAHVNGIFGERIRTWEGHLVRVEAAVDPRTRLVYGVVEVPEPFSSRHEAPLAPGSFVTAQIEGAHRETLVAAPRSALKRNEYVYVINADNTIDVREVTPAQTTVEEVMFRVGVADGERVIISTLPSATDGMEVTPMDPNAPGETPAPAAERAALDIRD